MLLERLGNIVEAINGPAELIAAGVGIGIVFFLAAAGTVESIFEDAEPSVENVSVSVDDLEPDLVRQVNQYLRSPL